MAGIGNVFKSEICFACGVHPFRKVDSLRAQEVECLLGLRAASSPPTSQMDRGTPS